MKAGEKLGFIVTTDSKDGLALLAHPMQLAAIGRHRVALAAALFVLTFAGIISEVIHRCYATFIGSFLALGLVSLVHEMPELPQIISMIDAGTLMLLFAMMINVHILSLTGAPLRAPPLLGSSASTCPPARSAQRVPPPGLPLTRSRSHPSLSFCVQASSSGPLCA